MHVNKNIFNMVLVLMELDSSINEFIKKIDRPQSRDYRICAAVDSKCGRSLRMSLLRGTLQPFIFSAMSAVTPYEYRRISANRNCASGSPPAVANFSHMAACLPSEIFKIRQRCACASSLPRSASGHSKRVPVQKRNNSNAGARGWPEFLPFLGISTRRL
jgi:hypothetical protein